MSTRYFWSVSAIFPPEEEFDEEESMLVESIRNGSTIGVDAECSISTGHGFFHDTAVYKYARKMPPLLGRPRTRGRFVKRWPKHDAHVNARALYLKDADDSFIETVRALRQKWLIRKQKKDADKIERERLSAEAMAEAHRAEIREIVRSSGPVVSGFTSMSAARGMRCYHFDRRDDGQEPMSEYNVAVEWENDLDEIPAKDAMRALCEAYPGHPWFVDARGGVLVIKHMRMSSQWGMCMRLVDQYDAADMKKRAVRLGGEFLERANMKRGADKGDVILAVEGIPTKNLLRI